MIDWIIANFMEAIVTFAIATASAAVARYTGKEIEARHREALHSAIMTGIAYARSAATDVGPATSPAGIATQAQTYVEKSVPDALSYFGMIKDKGTMLRDMIAAKVQELGGQLASKT